MRFSGHDTFHCKEQWLLKGLQLIKNEGNKTESFKDLSAIPKLGVGKNMVRSILHWLKSFGVINNNNEISEIGNLIFLVNKLDPYLENEGTLWLLQYYLCKTNYASIYRLIFSDFFSDKATLEFSESQILKFLERVILKNNLRAVTETTLKSDFKVFIKTYVLPTKNEKTAENDFNSPLISLSIISDTKRKNNLNQNVYRINRIFQDVSVHIFVYCLLVEFKEIKSISFDNIRTTLGSYLCLSNEGLEALIEEVCTAYNNQFVYKDDAGIRQLQIKELPSDFLINSLKKHYEI
jgi:hypothetical protein